MARSMHIVLRFVTGIVCTALVLKFIGITWADVDFFVKHGLGTFFEVVRQFKQFV